MFTKFLGLHNVMFVCISLCSPGNDAPVLASVTETAMTTHSMEMEPGEKGAAMGASGVTYNPYSKIIYRACSLKLWWGKIIIVNHEYTF